jgi:hypothetical protein
VGLFPLRVVDPDSFSFNQSFITSYFIGILQIGKQIRDQVDS